MRPPVGAPTLNRRTRILLIAAGVLVLLLLGGSRLITLYVDWLWFGEVGYRNVFTTIIFTRILQFLLGAVLIGGAVALSLWIAYRFRPVFVPVSGPEDPIAICVLGQNPFGGALEDVVRNKIVANRGFQVRDVANAQQASKCQIVFVTASERKRFRSLMEDLKGHSILTVGEADDFTASGGVINFKLKDARVRIEIDASAAERAKLHISSKLLSLAEIVKR